jgi:hypothetical protein
MLTLKNNNKQDRKVKEQVYKVLSTAFPCRLRKPVVNRTYTYNVIDFVQSGAKSGFFDMLGPENVFFDSFKFEVGFEPEPINYKSVTLSTYPWVKPPKPYDIVLVLKRSAN